MYNEEGDGMRTFVIFDLDGTLYDLFQPFEKACKLVLNENVPEQDELKKLFLTSRRCSDEFRRRGCIDTQELVFLRNRQAFHEHGFFLTDQTHRKLQEAYLYFQKHLTMEIRMENLLKKLSEMGVCLALLSNGESAHQYEKTKTLKLERFIKKENQFFSGMIGLDKPDVRLFRWVGEQLGIKSDDQVFFVGDSYTADMVGAHRAGWISVWSRIYVNEQPDADLAAADRVIYDYDTLEAFLVKSCKGEKMHENG